MKLLIKSACLCVAVVGATSAWAVDSTIKPTSTPPAKTTASKANVPAPTSVPVDSIEKKSEPLKTPLQVNGVLPCSDCAGIETKMELRPDFSVVIQEKYLKDKDEKPALNAASFYRVGRWSEQGSIVTVTTSDGVRDFLITENNTLNFIGPNLGATSVKPRVGEYQLKPQSFNLFPTQGFALYGEYRLTESGPAIFECDAGKLFPIANKFDQAALDKRVAKLGIEVKDPILLHIDGHIIRDSKHSSPASSEKVMIDRLLAATPGKSCKGRDSR